MSVNLIDVLLGDCMEIIQLYVLKSSCDDVEKALKDIIVLLLKITKAQYKIEKLKAIKERRRYRKKNDIPRVKTGILSELRFLKKSLYII
jgi:hypothetical protein